MSVGRSTHSTAAVTKVEHNTKQHTCQSWVCGICPLVVKQPYGKERPEAAVARHDIWQLT